MTVEIPVEFRGIVEVSIPLSVPPRRRKALAESITLARILATDENPDAPEDDACGEYEEQFKLTESQANREWDSCRIKGVAGGWRAT